MAFTYNQIRSEIFEQTMLPVFSYRDSEWDFTQKERSILVKDLEILEELYQLFLPYQEQIRAYHIMGAGWSFLTTCYFYLLNQDKEPSTIEDLHEQILALSEDELDLCLRLFLTDESWKDNKDKDYWNILEDAAIKPEDKWHLLAFSRDLKENVKKSVALSRELVALYQPYLDKSRAERDSYVKTLDLDALIRKAHALKMIQETLTTKDFDLYIVSPWLIRLSVLSATEEMFEKHRNFLILSCKINQLLSSHNELDEDNFTSALKSLSDVTRYKVLVALTQPHAKSKDIAEELGITSAAISFHRQKLQNAQLLLFNSDEKHVKYDPNRELIQAVIDKLKADFKLN
ncbi:ArsR/SmtB family transcription factor [Streptococcus plurextorum]|uniref:ArsR/SmtB family transcription factor n=1 Tax=Streptococcus plurextorum TaxID=456876 RepID=UPI0003FDC3B9|nr:winged helix-turn-helix domain-containing protein [Streptococcus plurextorum]